MHRPGFTAPRVGYDPATLAAPLVQLGLGEHHAEARLVELPGVGQPVKLIDAYHWSFTFGE